ncbi:MAG: 4Fe-4S binding protein [Deltaproteobacteria bacterium]|nr:4Fe-4S binding protein [Deltaproteobacteria bacterium]
MMAEKTDIPKTTKPMIEKADSHSIKKKGLDGKGTFFWKTRNRVQLGVLLVTIGIGLHFLVYVLQASGSKAVRLSRPPGVEGFLPIGALLGWKHFIITGVWDSVHPAAMVIFGFAVFVSIFLRKSFCGWFCPIGTLSECLWWLGKRFFGKNYRIPAWLDYPLRSLKYLLLGFFVWIILKMSSSDISAFLQSPYYKMSDVKMLYFFTRISATTTVVMIFLVLSSLIVRNSWCRYLCPYGALVGLLALLSPTRIQRNIDTCIDCKSCSEACPYYLPVDRKDRIISPECNGCLDCTLVCPVKDTLEMKTRGFKGKAWTPVMMGAVIIGFFVLSVYIAGITGHWRSSVSEHEFRMRLMEVDSSHYTHPDV